MSYNLSEQERKVLDHLASGFTERETYLQLSIPHAEFSGVWDRIRDEIQGNVAETIPEMDIRHAFHRVERRQLEAELWASNARLTALMDTAPDPILVINGRTGRIESVNNQTVLTFGYS